MRILKPLLGFIVVLTFIASGASAQSSSNPIPHKTMNSIFLSIQKQMTFSSINEKTSLIWTPKVIELQSLEAEPLLPSLYTPQETLYRLSFDVGIGHNMDEAVVQWRKCEATISRIESSWGAPIVSCESLNL